MRWPWQKHESVDQDAAQREFEAAFWSTRSRARLLTFVPGDPGNNAVTKLGGVPWWPRNRERPRCPEFGHLMAFVAQYRLADLPELNGDPGLLSFHYCQECQWDALMSYGWIDLRNRSYAVTCLDPHLDEGPDDRGTVAEPIFAAHSVTFEDHYETPTPEDWPATLTAGARRLRKKHFPPNGEPPVCVDGCKLGGWPAWDQSAEWPEYAPGERMFFVAQLDHQLGTQSGWGGGGHAFLFVAPRGTPDRRGELVIQVT